jgi:putative transcriptional regulator
MKASPCAALISLLAFCAVAHAQDATKAMFLVAKPGMSDPNFQEAVVLAVQTEDGAATGIIVNRPTGLSLAELLPSERFRSFTDLIFFGGPVAQQGLFALFQSDKYSGAAVPILPGVYFAVVPDTVDALLGKPPARIRFYSGYSGWAPGQLQSELDRGDWLLVDADPKTPFLKDTSRLWQDLVRRARAVRADAPGPRWSVATSSTR